MLSYKIDEAINLANKYINADTPFAFQGSHGIGKSQGLEALARSLGLGFVDLRLTLFEETDLIGMPYRDGEFTRYSKPIWLKLIEDQSKDKGLLCLEELNRCDALVRQPALQLLWDRKCSHFDIPEGWMPVATWNPSGENYETQELDKALLSRLIVLNVVADLDSWLVWAQNEGNINSRIINFLKQYPRYFANEELNITPRTWAIVSTLVDKYPTDTEVLKPILGLELALEVAKREKCALDKLSEKFSRVIDKKDIDSLVTLMCDTPTDQIISYFMKLKKNNPDVALKLLLALKNYPSILSFLEKLNGTAL